MGRNRRRRNQRRRREDPDAPAPAPEGARSGWRRTIDSFGGFTVVITLGAAVLAVVVLVLLNRPGSTGPATGPYEPIARGEVAGRIEGNPAAPVRVIEYADFQCPFCEGFTTDTAPLLLAEYVETGKASVEFRHFAILGPESLAAAAAAECALAQDHFWDYHDLLFLRQNGENRGVFSRGNLKDFARELQAAFPDFDVGAFDACVDSGETEQAVLDQAAEARDLGVQSTPSFFVNGQFVSGAQPIETFRQLIDAQLAD